MDVVLPTTLWPRGIVQDREYAAWDYGYHPEMLRLFKEQYGYDPREQEDPSLDVKWRQFRCDQINRSGQYDCRSGALLRQDNGCLPFLPEDVLAWYVRTGANGILTFVFPMVLPYTFYTGDASFISDCTVENARDKNDMTRCTVA